VVNGPFDDIAQYPMENALGITPKFDSVTASSKMCGNCHTINLPNIGQYPAWFTPQDSSQVLKRIEKNPAFKSYNHSIEQATYLEWLNSDFGPGADNTPSPPSRAVRTATCRATCRCRDRASTLTR
jgi:hypothetical protein